MWGTLIHNRQADIDRKAGREMILKVGQNSGWAIFSDFDRVVFHNVEKEGIVTNENTFNFTLIQEEDQRNREVPAGGAQGYGPIKEIWLYRGGYENARQIIAYSPVYLMNEQGRTVETI